MALNDPAIPPPHPPCYLIGRALVYDAGFPADALCVKLITVAVATPKPELGAGVGLGFVIPFHHVRAARPGIERLQAGGV